MEHSKEIAKTRTLINISRICSRSISICQGNWFVRQQEHRAKMSVNKYRFEQLHKIGISYYYQFITTTPLASYANCSFGVVIAAISAAVLPPSFA